MTSAQKLGSSMRPQRIYRRSDLTGLSTSVDRDLKTLVEQGRVKKLHGGLYYRPRKNPFGFTPLRDEELVRAFLKTGDFLLTSYNHFNQLGLGLTQLYNESLVYNHKRAGVYTLGDKRFRFLLVPAFPRKLSKEYLLVDLLNNLNRLPDNADRVRRNLPSHLCEFDPNKLRECAERYGRPSARRILQEAHA